MIIDKIKNLVEKLNTPIPDLTYADYYNGSDNELENIFLEIIKLSEKPVNLFSVNDLQRRLDFLANEGLNIISFSGKVKPFKVTAKEADALILSLAKKTKKVKKTVKKITKKK
jgi:hypothetical protein